MTVKKYNIKVLCGGDSPEREVSLESGKAVSAGLEASGHKVTMVDLKNPMDLFRVVERDLPDIFFVALHGGWGEDGRAQSVLDLAGVPYTGSGPSGCAVSMDKMLSKGCFSSAGLDVPWGMVKKRGDLLSLEEHLSRWGKLVIKPCCGGSTVATSIVEELAQVDKALEAVWQLEERALIEAFIPGRELTVAVLEQRGLPSSLSAVEIIPESGFYDYEAKYSGGSQYTSPGDLSSSLYDLISQAAMVAHDASGCKVYSRVDFRLDEEGRPWILEVNSAPGMTSNSLVPKAAFKSGIAFPELLNRIVNESMCR